MQLAVSDYIRLVEYCTKLHTRYTHNDLEIGIATAVHTTQRVLGKGLVVQKGEEHVARTVSSFSQGFSWL